MSSGSEAKDLSYSIDKIIKAYTDVRALEQNGGTQTQLRNAAIEVREQLQSFAGQVVSLSTKTPEIKVLVQAFGEDFGKVHTVVNVILTNPISDDLVPMLASMINQKLSGVVAFLTVLKKSLK